MKFHPPILIRTSLVAALLAGLPALAATELAKVDGAVITDVDVKAALSQFNEGQRENMLKDANTRRQMVSMLVDQEVLVKEAEKEKLDQDKEYKEAMANLRKRLLTDRILAKYLSSKVTDSAAKKFYEGHKDRYSTSQVHAMHILVDTEEAAKEIMKKAKEPGADFGAMAEKSSKDPSAKNNRGDLGYFGRDRMVAEFTEAAFSGSPGEIVGPVKTSYGYHIIKVVDKRDGKHMTYDEIELRVKGDLRAELTQAYLAKLRGQAKVTVNDKAIDKM